MKESSEDRAMQGRASVDRPDRLPSVPPRSVHAADDGEYFTEWQQPGR